MNAFARIDKEGFFRFMAKRREERYEYVKGRIVQQMTGGTRGHGLVTGRITDAIRAQLDQGGWLALNHRGVDAAGCVRDPETSVEPADAPGSSVSTKAAVIVVEVPSPSASAMDLDEKPAEYTSLASLDACAVASRTEPAILLRERGVDGRFPETARKVEGRDAVVKIRGRGFPVELPLAVIYRGIGAG